MILIKDLCASIHKLKKIQYLQIFSVMANHYGGIIFPRYNTPILMGRKVFGDFEGGGELEPRRIS